MYVPMYERRGGIAAYSSEMTMPKRMQHDCTAGRAISAVDV